MIGDLLAFARGGADPHPEAVDLGEVVGHVLEDLHDAADGVEVTVGELPTVAGDPAQVRALVQNLLANAMKFTRGGAAPAVTVGARPAEDGWWRTEVTDNGPGIPAADRERVFEPFTRIDKSVPGTGIGLSTCRRIVEAHGGRIGLEGAPGGGTRAWFELPDA